jgi:hypothetical protein
LKKPTEPTLDQKISEPGYSGTTHNKEVKKEQTVLRVAAGCLTSKKKKNSLAG